MNINRKSILKFIKYLLLLLIVISCKDTKNENSISNAKNEKLKLTFENLESIIELFDIKNVAVNTNDILMQGIFYGIGTIDIDGNIYLVGDKHEIYKIDSRGNLINRLLKVGNGPGEYLSIGQIITDQNKTLYIDDHLHNRILVYDSTFKYVNYIDRKTTSLSSFSSFSFVNGKILVGLCNVDSDFSLFKYNITTFKLINKCCSPDNRALQFNSFINIGDIAMDGDQLFYIKPHYYQIYREDNCNELEIMNTKSSSFIDIDKKIKTVYQSELPYSVLAKLYCENKFFIIKFGRNSEGHKNYDIIAKDGSLIKENVPLNFKNDLILMQYTTGQYFTFSYQIDDHKEPRLIVHLLKLKERYW